jgi:hypothetical protein
MTCRHEAAHSLMRIITGTPFYEMALDVGHNGVSRALPPGSPLVHIDPRDFARIAMAGPASDDRFSVHALGRAPLSPEESFGVWMSRIEGWNEECDAAVEAKAEISTLDDFAFVGEWAGVGYATALAMLEVCGAEITMLGDVLLERGIVRHADIADLIPGFDAARARAAVWQATEPYMAVYSEGWAAYRTKHAQELAENHAAWERSFTQGS